MPPFRRDDVEGARRFHGEARERRCTGALRKAYGVSRDQVNRFNPGQVVATPGALAAIGVSGDDLSTYLARHQSGDWGDIEAHDRRENQLSLEQGFRLMSVYTLSITGVKIWVITEADRSSTCILLPEEY
jgi:mRNA degradation ribonuclease J1/J2